MQAQVTAVRLPNGKIQIISSSCGHVNEVFDNEVALHSMFRSINEGAGVPSIQILANLNE